MESQRLAAFNNKLFFEFEPVAESIVVFPWFIEILFDNLFGKTIVH